MPANGDRLMRPAFITTSDPFMTDKQNHLRRLRELEGRLLACQSAEAEDNIQKLIDAENHRWQTAQQTTNTKTP